MQGHDKRDKWESRNARFSDQPTDIKYPKNPSSNIWNPHITLLKPLATDPQLPKRLDRNLVPLIRRFPVRSHWGERLERKVTAVKMELSKWLRMDGSVDKKLAGWVWGLEFKFQNPHKAHETEMRDPQSQLPSICEILFQWETTSANKVRIEEGSYYQPLASAWTCTHAHVHPYTYTSKHAHMYKFKNIKRLVNTRRKMTSIK